MGQTGASPHILRAGQLMLVADTAIATCATICLKQ